MSVLRSAALVIGAGIMVTSWTHTSVRIPVPNDGIRGCRSEVWNYQNTLQYVGKDFLKLVERQLVEEGCVRFLMPDGSYQSWTDELWRNNTPIVTRTSDH